MSDRIEVSDHATTYIGEGATSLFRLITLSHGLRGEIRGIRLTRGRTCYAIIKQEFGLKGNREKVLAQFLALVEDAKAKVPVVQER